ncbi:MAG TPA: TetR/AcrR family transcriptional regulator [Bacillota bacterium]|nr:TetR/AcrR family transcriptional regulator [Bacillota bacterium]
MARISKDPDERRREIINAAEKLFNEKGFENTAVSDIVKSIGVAQGTFYYYFKSKDDVFCTIAEEFLDTFMESFVLIVDNEKLDVVEKVEMIFDKGIELIKNNEGVMFNLHTRDNMELHEKVERKFIEYATPLVIKIVKQGIEEKIFDIEYPEEVVTFLMMGSHFLGDLNIYLEGRDIYIERLQAVVFIAQRVLGIDKSVMERIIGKYMDRFINLVI